MFAGHIKALGGPHVARGPDVAQAWSRGSEQVKTAKHYMHSLKPKNTWILGFSNSVTPQVSDRKFSFLGVHEAKQG